jgi:hypothetical protein
VVAALPAFGQGFDSGSDGSYGDLVITNDTLLPLPDNGIFNCKTITIHQSTHLSFTHNAANTPVFLLSKGDILIDGEIDLGGSQGNQSIGGLGGPGGFPGGHPGFGSVPPGSGTGPGGGRGGSYDSGVQTNGAGGGGYLYQSGWGVTTNHGLPYGTPVLIPLVGGSGGGGTIGPNGQGGYGGGGGGGAILMASSTQIIFGQNGNSGVITAYGGPRAQTANGGSGGAIRVVAPKIIGTVRAYVNGESDVAGAGRVRIDTADSSQMGTDIRPGPSGSLGSFLVTGLATNMPRLSIVQAAGTSIPAGQLTPVSILLPSGTSQNQTVTVQVQNFGAKVPINVVLTPDSGDPLSFPAEIDNTTSNPATGTINVTVPINVPVALNVWTR